MKREMIEVHASSLFLSLPEENLGFRVGYQDGADGRGCRDHAGLLHLQVVRGYEMY